MLTKQSPSQLRLLLWDTCNKRCAGCCNKDWDLLALPICKNYKPYKTIMLTGGEPMLFPTKVHTTINQIRRSSKAMLYLYTARVINTQATIQILQKIDGICVTLHDQSDVAPFFKLASAARGLRKSLRVNIFDNVDIGLRKIPTHWRAKTNIKRIPNCPIPDDEVFMRI